MWHCDYNDSLIRASKFINMISFRHIIVCYIVIFSFYYFCYYRIFLFCCESEFEYWHCYPYSCCNCSDWFLDLRCHMANVRVLAFIFVFISYILFFIFRLPSHIFVIFAIFFYFFIFLVLVSATVVVIVLVHTDTRTHMTTMMICILLQLTIISTCCNPVHCTYLLHVFDHDHLHHLYCFCPSCSYY